MSKYIDSLERDRAENEIQKKARIIGDLVSRLTWLENEIVNAGGRLELTEEEETEKEVFRERPPAASLHLQRLEDERGRTLDLLLIEQLRERANAIPDKTQRLFFLIEEQSKYLYDRKVHETGLTGWMGQLPDWIVPSEDGVGFDEKFAKHLVESLNKDKVVLFDELENYLHAYIPENYFTNWDMAALIGELIDEVKQGADNVISVEVDNIVSIEVNNPDLIETEVNLPKMSIAEVALLHIYLSKAGGQSVTKQNQDYLAAGYGLTSKTSGTHVYIGFKKYLQDSERLNINTSNKRSASEHLRRFNTIIPILESLIPTAAAMASKDLDTLQKLYDKHF